MHGLVISNAIDIKLQRSRPPRYRALMKLCFCQKQTFLPRPFQVQEGSTKTDSNIGLLESSKVPTSTWSALPCHVVHP